ncbi:hypothetical protein HK096_001829 [Nowakowskiella sp. JEL0078]|nr:hypothetical protein HK096_001829 [Nowakowskiella sp. JEL0078]
MRNLSSCVDAILECTDHILIDGNKLTFKFTQIDNEPIFSSTLIHDTCVKGIAASRIISRKPIQSQTGLQLWNSKKIKRRIAANQFWGGVRDGVFGEDFVLKCVLRSGNQKSNSSQNLADQISRLRSLSERIHECSTSSEETISTVFKIETCRMEEQRQLSLLTLENFKPHIKRLFIDSLFVTEDWITENNSRLNSKKSVYSDQKWKELQDRCLQNGLRLEFDHFQELQVDRTLTYLRRYLFFDDISGWSLLQALRSLSHVWVDKLIQFLDHDYRNKEKQIQIISQMVLPEDFRYKLLRKVRDQAIRNFFSIPLSLEYLKVTGYYCKAKPLKNEFFDDLGKDFEKSNFNHDDQRCLKALSEAIKDNFKGLDSQQTDLIFDHLSNNNPLEYRTRQFADKLGKIVEPMFKSLFQENT